MLRLYTFVISHFSEKARWALDGSSVAYEERRLLPGPHMIVVRRLAPKTTVPVLEHDGKIVQGSRAVLDYIEGSLGASWLSSPPHGAARGVELEELADHAFGLGVQRILYDTLLPDRATVTDLWAQDGPWWARAFYAVGYPAVAQAVRRLYKIRPDAVQEAKDRFRSAFDVVDRELSGRPYLQGDSPTRVDITVASLLAPVCRPPEHVVRWPSIPEGARALVAELEGRPTWNHVLKMYREHRRAKVVAPAREARVG